jgi:hypothetical protein
MLNVIQFLLVSAILLLLQLARIIPLLLAAFVGVLLAPKLKLRRITGACLAALLVVLFDDLYFTTVGQSPWRWLLLLPAALLLAPWYAVPLVLYRRTLPLGPADTEPFGPARHPVSDATAAWVRQTVAVLAAEGFAPVDDVVMHLPTKATARSILMDDVSGSARAVLLAVEGARGGPNNSLAFFTVLADGRWVAVSNSSRLRPHPPLRDTVGVAFPDLHDAHELLAAFRAFVRQTGGEQPRTLPPGANAREYTEVNARRQQVEMFARGWFRPVPGGYRLSLRAAFMSSWGALFPLHQLRLAARRKEQDRVLRTLGMEPPRHAPEDSPGVRWFSFGGMQATVAAAMLAFGLAWPRLAEHGGFAALRPSAGVAADTVVPERLPPGFAVPADFPGAVAALERLAVARAQPLATRDDYDSHTPGDAMSVPVAKGRVDALLAAAQPVFLARGFVLFHTELLSSTPSQLEALALFRSRDPFDALQQVGTNGDNYGRGTAEVAAWLRAVDREHPLIVTGASFDYVEARFRRPLPRAEARVLAARVARFCPDVVTQGTRTVAALASEIQSTRRLYCWWD